MSYLTKQQVQAVANSILSGFNRHFSLFRSISAKAKYLFENQKWAEIQKITTDRIRMYDDRVAETVTKLKENFSANVLNR